MADGLMHPVRDLDFEALRSLRSRYGAVYPRGRVIFHQGETSTEFYVVLQGSVAMSVRDASDTDKIVRVMKTGEFFGEMAGFCNRTRTARAFALEDSVLLSFNKTAILELLQISPRFALGMIQTLCDRIEADTEIVAEARKQLGL